MNHTQNSPDSTETPVDFEAVVPDYLETWNTTDPHVRLSMLRGTWAPNACYTDPLAEVRGPEAVSDVIGAVQGQFAGMVFSPVGGVDSHHRQARFQWGLGPAGQEPVVIGFDVLTLDEQGRVQDVRGFLDRVPT